MKTSRLVSALFLLALGGAARGEGDTGDFMVVRVTDNELIIAQRKLDGTWGIQMRRPLQAAPAAQK